MPTRASLSDPPSPHNVQSKDTSIEPINNDFNMASPTFSTFFAESTKSEENSEVALDDMVLDESDGGLISPLLSISSTTSNILASDSSSSSDSSSEAHKSSSVMYCPTMNSM